jgi:hypothetical protein
MYVQRISSRRESVDFPPVIAQEPYSGPSVTSSRHKLDEEKTDSFLANPMSIVGKEFIYALDKPKEVPYKVVGLDVSEDGVLYRLKFIDLSDVIEVSHKEMRAMILESVLVV